MYEPARIPRRLTRRGKRVAFVMIVVTLVAIVVTVVRTMPDPPPADPLTLDELKMIIPDAAHTEMLAAMVRARIAENALDER
jgi:hypothetical protein